MTIGIYALYWREQELIYIGQSVNIEKRFKEHLSSLKYGKHINYKVQNAYNLYGEPEQIILEKTREEDLNKLEIIWMAEFNIDSSLLNITQGGSSGGSGIYNSNSKYTKRQLLKTFSLLYKTILPYKNIEKRTGVSIDMCKKIVFSKNHSWIKDTYPHKFKQLENNIPVRINPNCRGGHQHSDFKLRSPEGILHSGIYNIHKFATDHKLCKTNLNRLVNGKQKSHLGWTLVV